MVAVLPRIRPVRFNEYKDITMRSLRLKGIAVVVMFAALGLGLVAHVNRRTASFKELAAYHSWAAFSLRNRALGLERHHR